MMSYEWSPPYAGWIYLGLAPGLLALLLVAHFLARAPAARSWCLLLLRGGVLALLIVLLLNLTRVSEARLPARVPEVVYLVDGSRSMALDRPISRLNQVRQAIEESQNSHVSAGPRVSMYYFGDRLTAVNRTDELRAIEDATLLRGALERLPAHFTDGPPAGVVIFSDGQATESTGFAEVAAGYRRLGVPLHVFPVGDSVSGDVAIEDVIAPRDAPAGARLPVRVVVRSRGYAGKRAEVRIRSLAEPARRPLAALPVTLAEGAQTHELLLGYNASASRLIAEVSSLPGEAIVENNQVPFQIGARKPRIRVIYMEGTLNNEYRWVRDALVEDPNIECLVLEVNNQYAARPTLHRLNDPSRGYPTTREELFSHDVVLCSDISRSAFTQDQLDWTVELVHKRGGGFAMIGGNTSFGAGFWDRTVWDGLIPVDMSGQARSPGRGTCWGVSFTVKVPRELERHPIWRIVDDPVQNRRVLDAMPPFTGSNLVERLKPAATALGLSDRSLPNVGIMPVFSCQPYGKGRTFAMSTDTTEDWGIHFERSWGEGGDNRYFRKFWRNVVLWLGENSAGANRRLRIESDKVIYRPGQPIRVSARAYDEKLEETGRYRLVARLRPTVANAAPRTLQEITLAARSADRLYEGELKTPPLSQVPLASGNPLAGLRMLALDVVAHDGEKIIAQATLDVQVRDDPLELQNPQPDPARLEALARDSGGRVLHNAAELNRLLSTFTSAPGEVVVRKAPVWDHPALWLLLLGMLTTDWLLRRWWGLG
jgi:uncharacterized membrane protein